MNRCRICGTDLSKDLFSAVTQEICCSICKVKWVGGLPTTQDRVDAIRRRMGLAEGEYLQQNNAAEAGEILGRKRRR